MDRLPRHSFAERINGCVEHTGRGVLRRQWHDRTLPRGYDISRDTQAEAGLGLLQVAPHEPHSRLKPGCTQPTQ